MALFVRKGGSRHAGQAALPQRNIQYNYILHTFVLKDVPTDPTSLGWIRYIFCLNRIVPAGVEFWENLSATWTISTFLLFYFMVPLLHKLIHNSKTAFAIFLLEEVIVNVVKCPEPVEMLQFFLLGILLYYVVLENKDWKFVTISVCYIMAHGVMKSTWTVFIYAVIFSIIILSTKQLKIQNYFIKRLIDVLDEYSYTIYLVHAVVIEWFDRTKWSYFFWQYNKAISFLVIVLITLVGVVFVHNVVELPIRKIYNRVISRKV
ncbi:MAG: hypothetical protein MSH15_01530 [Oscillospiraceae bacterium]|nr:hypothetical protein [Oscillospiraceae bacterium]